MFDITVGMPLAMRFYDSASIETSTYFNAVTSATGEWNWVESPDSGVRINVVLEPTSSLIWQDGSDSAFRTTIPVPEPATALLLVIAGTGACLFRRR